MGNLDSPNDSLIIPQIEAPMSIYTVLIVGQIIDPEDISCHYSDLSKETCYEDRRVFRKTYFSSVMTRMCRKTSYGKVSIDFIWEKNINGHRRPLKSYPKPIDEVIYFLDDPKNLEVTPGTYTKFESEKYTQNSITLSLKYVDPSGVKPDQIITQEKTIHRFIICKEPPIYRFSHIPMTPAIGEKIQGMKLDRPTGQNESFMQIPYFKVNLETGDGMDDFFRSLLAKLTSKPDIVFGDPLTPEEISMIEKVRALRSRGIII